MASHRSCLHRVLFYEQPFFVVLFVVYLIDLNPLGHYTFKIVETSMQSTKNLRQVGNNDFPKILSINFLDFFTSVDLRCMFLFSAHVHDVYISFQIYYKYQWKLFLSEVNNRVTIAAIEANKDTYCLQNE